MRLQAIFCQQGSLTSWIFWQVRREWNRVRTWGAAAVRRPSSSSSFPFRWSSSVQQHRGHWAGSKDQIISRSSDHVPCSCSLLALFLFLWDVDTYKAEHTGQGRRDSRRPSASAGAAARSSTLFARAPLECYLAWWFDILFNCKCVGKQYASPIIRRMMQYINVKMSKHVDMENTFQPLQYVRCSSKE